MGAPVSLDALAAHEALGRVHRDGADGRFAQMLRHFQHQPLAVVLGFERVQNRGQMAVELHVHHRSHHLGDAADPVGFPSCAFMAQLRQSASAPEMISISSLVIIAWRVRLYCSVSAVDDFAGVARRRIHRRHLGAKLAGDVLKQRAENLHVHVARQ